jgi:DNA modification methylase
MIDRIPDRFSLETLALNVTWGKSQVPKDLLQYFESAECGDCYVCRMINVFREVRRCLRRDGTLWLNLGSTMAASRSYQVRDNKHVEVGNDMAATVPKGFKPKDLIPIPWMVAMALQRDGWWLRSDIIWAKPNPMPESCTDRCTKSHEYLFMFAKSANYFWDAEAIREPYTPDSRKVTTVQSGNGAIGLKGISERERWAHAGRNKRTVWTVATEAYGGCHFATFPSKLITPCILAGTSARGCCPKCGAPWERIVEKSGGTTGKSWHNHENDLGRGQRGGDDGNVAADAWSRGDYKVETTGWQPGCTHGLDPVPCTVLDCCAGSGCSGMVALELGRKAVLIELNPAYVKLIEERCNVTMGLALA